MKKRSAAAEAALEAIKRYEAEANYTHEVSTAELDEKLDYEKSIYENSNAFKSQKLNEAKSNFRSDVRSLLIESTLDYVVNKSFKNRLVVMSEDSKNLAKSLIKQFVAEEGAENLLYEMSTRSNLLAEVARYIKEEVDRECEEHNNCPDNMSVNPDIKDDLYNKLDGTEEIQDITDQINNRVSLATQNFIQKNMSNKMDIKDLMATTRDRIENVRTGSEEEDQEFAQEAAIRMKKEISKINNRPHSIYEQLVINITEAIVKNDDTRKKFTNESGKLNMDAIVERAQVMYTMLESINSLQLKKMTKEYIQEAISMK